MFSSDVYIYHGLVCHIVFVFMFFIIYFISFDVVCNLVLYFFFFMFFFFFFKQKTAYEMRISDWSSDVCSSDLDPSACAARYAPSICGRASSVRRTAAPSVSVSIAVSLMPTDRSVVVGAIRPPPATSIRWMPAVPSALPDMTSAPQVLASVFFRYPTDGRPTLAVAVEIGRAHV